MKETQETYVRSLSQEDPQRTKWHHTPVFLPGKFHEPKSLAGYNPGVARAHTYTHTHTHTIKKLIMFEKSFAIIIYFSVTHMVYVELFSVT